MFTGIIENIGEVAGVRFSSGAMQLTIRSAISRSLRRGDSIAINGCCQTVVNRTARLFIVTAVEETLEKTNFAKLRVGSRVNLERPMIADGRFGGHFVLGHVDCAAIVKKIEKAGTGVLFWFVVPARFRGLLVPAGSVAVNGVSLTVARIVRDTFGVAIIPFTFEHTTFGSLKRGETANVEFDIIGKYARQLVKKI